MTADGSRSAGVCLHISSLPGRWGIGDIGAGAREFIDWMQAAALGVWQFLPLGPTGLGDSPYQLLSIHAGNPLFIDLDGLAEVEVLTRDELAAHPHLPADRVDYRAVIEARRPLLAAAASRLDAQCLESLQDEYMAFVAENDACWLHDFALYSVLKARHGGAGWGDWREVYRVRDERALRRVEQSERRAIPRR